MNVPGRIAGNWRWRCTEDMLSVSAFQWLRDLTESSHRLGALSEASSLR
jgi:4-alpha-glucanotransferase